MLQRYDIDSQTRFNKGIPILEATILQYPDHPEPLLLTAMFHFQCNKESQSIPYFEKGITLLENNPKLQKSGLRMSISILASCYAQDSQYDKVQGLIKKLEPSGQNVNPDDYLELGKLYEIIKDYSTALNYYQKAAGGNPTKRDNLGIIRCQTRLNQDQAVDSTLQDYFVTHNDLASKRYMYEQLFHNYDDINQCERAAEYYHKYIVVSMDSSRRDSDLSRSLILYGNKPGHLERYTDYFRKRVKQDSEDWISWGILAGLCYYQGISPQGLEKKYH
jgi:tetratricopeptide (TPR) repeat protein